MFSTDYVRKKVVALMQEKGTTRTKLGEVLGSNSDDPRTKISRASRFLDGRQKSITLDEINALARFFHIPAEHLISIDASVSITGDQLSVGAGQNNVQNHVSGKNNTVNTNISTEDQIKEFLSLPTEERKMLLEFLKSKK
jgi:transcriptional regulator with XRE-family HTH domain